MSSREAPLRTRRIQNVRPLVSGSRLKNAQYRRISGAMLSLLPGCCRIHSTRSGGLLSPLSSLGSQRADSALSGWRFKKSTYCWVRKPADVDQGTKVDGGTAEIPPCEA